MTQVALPISDVTNVNWSPAPLYEYIGQPEPDDSSPIGTLLPPGGLFIVQLAPLARPITGTHTLTVRVDEIGTHPALLTFALLQGEETIAARSVVPTPNFTDYEIVLTEDEVDLITDYTDLFVLVSVTGIGLGSGSGSGSLRSGSASGSGSRGSVSGSGGGRASGGPSGSRSGQGSGSGSGGIVTICCPGGIPDTLSLSISSPDSNCVLNGATATLTYNDGSWIGVDNRCGVTWQFSCSGSGSQTSFSLSAKVVVPGYPPEACAWANYTVIMSECGPPLMYSATFGSFTCCPPCSNLTVSIMG
jgi:hypothetical protein